MVGRFKRVEDIQASASESEADCKALTYDFDFERRGCWGLEDEPVFELRGCLRDSES